MSEQQGTAVQVSPDEAARAAEAAAAAAAQAAARAAADARAATAQTAQAAQGLTGDLSGKSHSQLRQMLEELRSQRSDFASRRSALAESYEASTGANREGMGERLKVLDNTIVAYEAELGRVGREIAVKVGSRGFPTGNPTGQQNTGYNDDDIAGAVFGTFLTTLLVTIFLTKRFMRRKYNLGRMGAPVQPNMIQSEQRLDRIEQAVDTIAVEMERVSENQRFMTRLMTETQLGDTLKDVRKSTELAKSAAAAEG